MFDVGFKGGNERHIREKLREFRPPPPLPEALPESRQKKKEPATALRAPRDFSDRNVTEFGSTYNGMVWTPSPS